MGWQTGWRHGGWDPWPALSCLMLSKPPDFPGPLLWEALRQRKKPPQPRVPACTMFHSKGHVVCDLTEVSVEGPSRRGHTG